MQQKVKRQKRQAHINGVLVLKALVLELISLLLLFHLSSTDLDPLSSQYQHVLYFYMELRIT